MHARLVSLGQLEIDGRRFDYDVVEGGRIRRRKTGPSKTHRDRYGHTPLSTISSYGRSAMPKSTRNTGTRWTPGEVERLRDLAKANTPTRVIGLELGRTPGAVGSKAAEQHISLKPPNQSPYSHRTKG